MFAKKVKTSHDAWDHFTELVDDSNCTHECMHCPLTHTKFKYYHNIVTKGSYESTQPLKHLKMPHHDIWLTTKSGKKSEAKEEAAKKDWLAKLVSFNKTNETEVKIEGVKEKKKLVQSQRIIMKTSTGGTSFLLDAERATI